MRREPFMKHPFVELLSSHKDSAGSLVFPRRARTGTGRNKANSSTPDAASVRRYAPGELAGHGRDEQINETTAQRAADDLAQETYARVLAKPRLLRSEDPWRTLRHRPGARRLG